MKKIKIKQRIENARNAFFADETFDTNDFPVFRNEAALLQDEKSENFTRKTSALETILKQVLLFFPGTLVLFFLSIVSTVSSISMFVNPSGLIPRYRLVSYMAVFLAATLMTWLGLGDVRKPKHLVIPASIITVGVIYGAVAGALMAISPQFGRTIFYNFHPLNLLPLALIVPFLAKGWVDRKLD
jgi:hypothetical protein